MITANRETALGYWCAQVDRMKPGERLDVSMDALWDIPGFDHNGAHFTPADRILENVVGSGYTHSYQVHPSGAYVTFERHEETDERRYQSPDRR